MRLLPVGQTNSRVQFSGLRSSRVRVGPAHPLESHALDEVLLFSFLAR